MARIVRAGIAGCSALALALLAPVATASAQEGAPVITNTETVNASLDPSGDVDVIRVYDQIAIQGSGEVSYSNPVSTAGLRNLDSFGGFTVEGDAIVEDTTVDGQQRRRAVSDFDPEMLPATIQVTYRLDGQEIDPADLVGKSGEVEATFRVENNTGQPEEITFADGTGGIVTKTVDVYDPFAGSLSFTLPSTFTDVVSDDGFVPAGDGRGGTLMNLSITMISGLTDPFVEASYTATVTNASLPPVTLSLVPVLVEANPSSAAQLEALRGGAGTGEELASNGALLDENVLALADGARGLVNGLIQLRDGAGQLSAGLVNDAAPGAGQLADGLGLLQAQVPTLVDGVGQLNDGGNQLEAGLGELQNNVPALVDGVSQLNAGGNDLEDGLGQLQSQVPALVSGVDQLDAGGSDLANGLGQLQSQVPALTSGVAQLDAGAAQLLQGLQAFQSGTSSLPAGVDQLVAGANQLVAGLTQLQSQLAGPPSLVDGVNALAAGAEQISVGLNDLELALDNQFGPGLGLLANDLAAAAGASGLADQVIAGINTIKASNDPGPVPSCGPTCQLTADGVIASVNSTLRPQVQAAADGAAQLDGAYTAQIRPAIDQLSVGSDDLFAGLQGLQSQVPALVAGVDQLLAGAQQLQAGLLQLQGSLAGNPPSTPSFTQGVQALVDGATQVSGGLSQLNAQTGPLGDGVDQLADGATQLSAGLSELDSKTGPLAAGVDQLADGSTQLSDGLTELNSKTGPLADGVNQLADGSVTLSDGLEELNNNVAPLGDGVNQLADGANQLADGLGEAADGSVQLSSGLQDAAEAAPALPQGAERLSAEGTSLLVEAGADTAQSFGERVALLEASAERTADGGLPFGGPQGAIVAAAYRYDLSAATGATAQNTGQLIAGGVVAGVAVVGASVLARRKTA